MSAFDVRQMLSQTLQDHLLSRGEKQALAGWVSEFAASPAAMAEFRKLVFQLAHDEVTNERDRMILKWVEDVVRIQPAVAKSDAITPEVYFSPSEDCPRRIVQAIDSARESIDVCVFTITDDRISDALLAAHRREVTLRIITDDEKAYDPGSDALRLRDAGVPLRVDNTPFHMHHKFAIFDQRSLLTGSYNWTRGAARDNEENFLITGEPRFLDRFQTAFDKLWESLAK